MTLSSRHQSQNSRCPWDLRSSTLLFGCGGSTHYWIFTNERRRNILLQRFYDTEFMTRHMSFHQVIIYTIYTLYTSTYTIEPSRQEILSQCCFNIGPPSSTLAQYLPNTGWMSRVCWDGSDYPANTKKHCITFVQRRPNACDVGPALYKCYTNVLCSLGMYIQGY